VSVKRIFLNRLEAGESLADAVSVVPRGRCVVAAIPRGGVVVGRPVADLLHAPLALAFVRKVFVPAAPELAIGAVDEDGRTVVDECATSMGVTGDALRTAKCVALAEIQRQKRIFSGPALKRLLPGATAVLVDDGLATGDTMVAAVQYARRHGARRVVVAVPCASGSAAERIRHEADEFICLVEADGFFAVGAFYVDFAQVEDQEVCDLLAPPEEAGSKPGRRR
jgi:putative phosphoribosyl transferase